MAEDGVDLVDGATTGAAELHFPHREWFPHRKEMLVPGDLVDYHGEQQFLGYKLKEKHFGHSNDRALSDRLFLSNLETCPIDQLGQLPRVPGAGAESRAFAVDVSAPLKSLFDEFASRESSGLVNPLCERARALGHDVYIVGGAVRDLLRGVSVSEVNDLDMAGTLPSVLFADLVRWTALELCEPTGRMSPESRRRHAQFVDVPSVHISPSGVVHVSRWVYDDEDRQWSERKFLEYAPFKAVPESFVDAKLKPQFDRKHYAFLTGFDPGVDATWRDLAINCLLYDPLSAEILDPTGNFERVGTRPFPGLGSSDVSSWVPPVEPHPVRLVPIPLPPDSSRFWTAKAVARTLKSVAKYPDADVKPCGEWILRFKDDITRVELRSAGILEQSAATLESQLFAQFRGLDSSQTSTREAAKRTIDRALSRLVDAAQTMPSDLPDIGWFVEMVKSVIPGSSTSPLGDVRGVWPDRAEGLAPLVRVPGVEAELYTVGDPLPAVGINRDANIAFWKRAVRRLILKEVQIEDQEGMTNAFKVEGPHGGLYVPVDASQRMLPTAGESPLNEKDRTAFLTLFGETDVVHVSPDHEAPDPKSREGRETWKNWKAKGLRAPDPRRLRTRPDPSTGKLSGEDMTPLMHQMEVLKRFIRAGLVVPGGPHKDLYWACLNSGSVVLTQEGRVERERLVSARGSD